MYALKPSCCYKYATLGNRQPWRMKSILDLSRQTETITDTGFLLQSTTSRRIPFWSRDGNSAQGVFRGLAVMTGRRPQAGEGEKIVSLLMKARGGSTTVVMGGLLFSESAPKQDPDPGHRGPNTGAQSWGALTGRNPRRQTRVSRVSQFPSVDEKSPWYQGPK